MIYMVANVLFCSHFQARKRKCVNFSLHAHSVCDIICDAGPSLGEKILCSKIHAYPVPGK